MSDISSVSALPPATWGFLGAVVGLLLLLVLFFLCLNKTLCFANCGGFPCIDKPKKKVSKEKQRAKDLGNAYAYEDVDTSSDSDDDVLQNYQKNLKRGASFRNSKKKTAKTESNEQLLSQAEKGGSSYQPSVEGAREATEDVQPGTPSVSSKVSSHAPIPAPSDKDLMGSQQMLIGDQGDQPQQAYGATRKVSQLQEHLFDVSDLQTRDPDSVLLVSKCGSLQVTFTYDLGRATMTVSIGEAREIPSKERGGADNVQVKLVLLPSKKQKFKTKVKQGDNPRWDETFVFTKVAKSDLTQLAIMFRLVGNERMRRERLIGETVMPLQTVNDEAASTHWLTLEPRSNVARADSKADTSSLGSASESGSSMQSLQHGGMPELLLGLSYNGTTGRLSVEVIKGSSFRNLAMTRSPDTYVKLTLMNPAGQEMARSKTSIRRGQPNPLYKETFMFQVALFQLPEVTLMVSVYNKRSMKRKEMIGWFSLGLNSSGEEEVSHWSDMRESRGDEICRWHVLLES